MTGFVERFTEFRFNGSELVSIAFDPEFPEQRARLWIAEHWIFAVQMSVIYFFTIFGIKLFMRNREPFDLQAPLNAWNLFLAVFSTMGFIKMTPEFFGILFNKGFYASYCSLGGLMEATNGYWMWIFMLSKLAEFIDTIFIVLRKKPLMFLHWYHHILTLLYGFYSYPITPAFNRWGVYLNFGVHSFMYSYYFLRSMRVKIPGQVAKMITTMQIMQFVISVGILARVGVLVYLQGHSGCDFDGNAFVVAMLMDLSYLALFVNFFLQSYVLRGGKAKYSSTKKQE